MKHHGTMNPRSIAYGFAILSTVVTVLAFLSCGDQEVRDSSDSALVRLPQIDIPIHGTQFEEYKLSMSLATARDSATLYRFVSPKVDEAYARSVAQRFGIRSEPRYNEDGTYEFDADDSRLYVHSQNRAGRIVFRAQPVSGAVPLSQISDTDVETIAKGFLSDRGLLPQDATFAMAVRGGNGEWVDAEFKRSVFPKESWPWLPMSITLHIVGDGVIESVDYDWPEMEAAGVYPIISEEEAFHRFLGGEAAVSTALPDVGFSSVNLAYVTAGDIPGSSTVYAVPVYQFRGPEDQFAIVPALPDEYVLTQDVATPQ
jgi:hypothetical protein